MQLVAAIDASLSPIEGQTIGQLYKQVTGEGVDSERLRRESEKLRASADEVYAATRRLAPNLSAEQKEVLIRTLILVAFSDNQPQQVEYDCLSRIAQDLGVTQAHLTELIRATIKISDSDNPQP
jgi:uncharacterized tellurite resistance protein B-like protein